MLPLLTIMFAILVATIAKMIFHFRVRDMARARFAPMFCGLVGHRRARKRVRRTGNLYESRCIYCTLPMEKEGRDGNWDVVPFRGTEAAPAADTVAPSAQ